MGVCLEAGPYDGVEKCLDDPDAEVRAAAADAMGLMYGMEGHPEATGERSMTGMVVPTTVSDPPIGLYGSHLSSRYSSLSNQLVLSTPISRMPERFRRSRWA